MAHVRAAAISGGGVLCASGIRAWARRHDVDLAAFARDGMPLWHVETIDDAFARRVAAVARAELAVSGQERADG